MNNGVSALTYTYDDANQLLTETSLITADGPAKTIAYTYDADGNRQSITYPDTTQLTYAYTARNQLLSVSSVASVVQYSYDLTGNRLGKTLGNGTTANYAYDNASRLLSITHSNSAGQFARFDYTLNAVGNRTSKSEVGTTGSVVRVESYSYDPVDQLTNVFYSVAAVTNRAVNYQYDPVGNRQTMTDNGTNTAYTANNLNQYTAVGPEVPSYDPNGNLTTQTGWTYTYDAQNRLLSAGNGTTSVSFAYDARNRCIKRVTNGTTTYLTYDGWSLIEERDAGDNVLASYINGAVLDENLVRLTPNSQLPATAVYYHHDGLGSTTHLTDNTGALVESYQYDVYGAATILAPDSTILTSSPAGNRFLYTGREYLANLGLYDYRNRYYNPTFGRFLQTDPIRFGAGDVNLFRYVGNNSISFTDPLGWDAITVGPVTIPIPFTTNTKTEKEAEKAHEKKHRDDYWGGVVYGSPGWKCEQRGFAAEIPVWNKRVGELKAKPSLSKVEAAELQEVEQNLATAKLLGTNDEAAKQYWNSIRRWWQKEVK